MERDDCINSVKHSMRKIGTALSISLFYFELVVRKAYEIIYFKNKWIENNYNVCMFIFNWKIDDGLNFKIEKDFCSQHKGT